MKKLIALLVVLLFSPPAYAVCPVVTEGGVEHELCDKTYDGDVLFNGSVNIPGGVTDPSMVKQTTADTTLYVRTTGLDTNDCLSAGAACLTIQEAVDRVPKKIDHIVAIDIGAGNFTGFDVESFNVSRGASLSLTGTIENITPTSGPATGTTSGGDTDTCIHSGAGWTANDLRGSFVYVNSEYRIIRSNTTDTMELIGPLGATCSGKVYAIQEPSTVINAYGALGFARASVGFNTGARGTISLTNLFISGGVLGLMVWYTNAPNLERVICDTQTNTGVNFQDSWGRGVFRDCVMRNGVAGLHVERHTGAFYGVGYTERIFAVGNSANGVEIMFNAGAFLLPYWYADDNNIGFKFLNSVVDISHGTTAYSNTLHGFSIRNSKYTSIKDAISDSNGGYGFYVDDEDSDPSGGFTFFNAVGDNTVSNNTLGGIVGKNHTHIAISNCAGTGNGGYGLSLEHGSTATITTDTDITGSSGDATISDGSVVLTWATDFASDGDIETNLSNGCRIERRD